MARYRFLIGAITLVLVSASLAEVTVPEGFVVDTLLDQIDGVTPRLEAIRNPIYGYGVVAASVDGGILKVLRISQSSVDLLATMSGFPAISDVHDMRFDKTGLFGNKLYISVEMDIGGSPSVEHTQILEVSPDGEINMVASLGTVGDALRLIFDFTSGDVGYIPGAYLEDTHSGGGTSLYHMDNAFNLTKLSQHLIPSGRTDLDIWAMEFDPTGLYGSYLTMADSDDDDLLTVIYQLLPDLSWVQLTTPVSISTRFYDDMCFSSGGAFGQTLYVTDKITDMVMSVNTNGLHEVFASGFHKVKSITVNEDGNHMFVSDCNGIYRIREVSTEVGPTIVMREPWVEDDDVHTGPSGVDDLRLLWSEPVIFDTVDVNIVDEDVNDVPLSVSGSNSAFMIIVFGKTLLNDRYTITINDTVRSTVTGAAIDGDKDGLAGGDAVLVMEHRKRSDFDNDNDVDFKDFASFAMNWLWQE